MAVVQTNFPDYSGSAAISGKQWLMYYNYGEGATAESPVWNKLGATKDTPMEISADTIDATTKEDSGWGSTIPGTKSWSSSLELVAKADDQSFQVLEEWMFNDDLQAAKPAINVAFVNKATKDYYTGWCTISSLSLSASYSDVATWSVSLNGVGPIDRHPGEWVDPGYDGDAD